MPLKIYIIGDVSISHSAHRFSICNIPKQETTTLSIVTIHKYTRILFSSENECTVAYMQAQG